MLGDVHNKLNIQNSNEEYELYTKIIRDADKLDIMVEQLNEIKDDYFYLKDEIVNAVFKNKMIQNELLEHEVDYIIRLMCFIFDINFKYTFNYILDKKIIENKIHLLKCYIEDNRLEKIENYLIEYINKKVEE